MRLDEAMKKIKLRKHNRPDLLKTEDTRASDTQRYRTLRHCKKSVPLHRSQMRPKQMVKYLSALAVLVYHIV